MRWYVEICCLQLCILSLKVRGKAKDLIFAHDSSRVLQCLLAAGNRDIRDELFDELSPELKRMCKSQYARFFVVKLLKHG